jgi:uncharacterized protein
MTPGEIATLLAASFFAGGMNAIAGGGTILTFPALLAFGMPAIHANATSTLALLVGTVGSGFAYRTHMRAIVPYLRAFAVVSLAGGLLGAFLLTRTPEEAFSSMVPFLLLFATVLFMLQGTVRKWVGGPHGEPSCRAIWPVIAQFGVAVYGGYFGAGIGILMLAVLGLLGFSKIHEMNALKTILAAAINVVAAVWFVFAGLVVWPQAALMTVGSTLGYFAGAHWAQKIPERSVRALVILIGLLITASLLVTRGP